MTFEMKVHQLVHHKSNQLQNIQPIVVEDFVHSIRLVGRQHLERDLGHPVGHLAATVLAAEWHPPKLANTGL